MKEFKVGDKVKIKDDCPKASIPLDTRFRIGKIYEVSHIGEYGVSIKDEDDSIWWIERDLLEHALNNIHKDSIKSKTKLSISQLVHLKKSFSLEEIKELLKEGIL